MPNEFHISIQRPTVFIGGRRPILIEIILGGDGLMTPDAVPVLVEKVGHELGDLAGEEPVIISGRLPVWAFASLVHALHPRPWVATFDPRLGGGVVVSSHVPNVRVGQVIRL